MFELLGVYMRSLGVSEKKVRRYIYTHTEDCVWHTFVHLFSATSFLVAKHLPAVHPSLDLM